MVLCAVVFSVASLYMICAICLDRFLLVYKEYPQYVKIQSKRRIYINIAFAWLWPMAWGVIEISLWDVGKKIIDETTTLIDFSKICISPSRRIKAFAGPLFLQSIIVPIILVVGLSAGFFYLLHKRLVTSWSMRAGSQFGNQLATVSSSVEQQSARQAMSSKQRKQCIMTSPYEGSIIMLNSSESFFVKYKQ